MRAWVLGSGVPTPSATRACSGYVVEIDGRYIVFDHGFGAFQRLLELGVDPAKVSHLFLSHLHFDHMGDYGRLVLTRWDQGGGRVPDLEVFGPSPLIHTTIRLFGEEGVYAPDLIARTQDESSLVLYRMRGGVGERRRPAPVVRELKSGDIVEGRGWSVRAEEVVHFQGYLTCYAYRIEHAGQSLVYSGDTGRCDAMVELASNCDILIHMCHYISGTETTHETAVSATGHKQAAEIARSSNAKTLVLTHITSQIDRPGIRERVIADISRIYNGNIVMGHDLLELPINGILATRLD